MKLNKKHIGWIIGLVCVVILMVLGLRMCGSGAEDVTEPTDQTEESTIQTETTEATEETEETEPTEETTEPTEESTEETTEPTEATTFPTAPPTSSAIGSPGSLGKPEDPTEETTEPTEPTEPVIVPAGQDTNPYSEVIREYPAGFESVNVPGKSLVTYAVFVNSGAELTIENPDAYVIHGGKTYESVEGIVKLLLTAEKNAPVIFQLGNKAAGEKMFQLSFIDALGEPTNPQILEKIDEVKVELEEDDKTGYTFRWTAQEEGTVTFQVAEITEKVSCDVILTVGEMSAHLVQPKPDAQEPEKASEEEEEKVEIVSIGVSKGDELTIQVITLAPEAEAEKPAEGDATEPTDPTNPTEPTVPEKVKLPGAKITLKGEFKVGVNEDKEEQEQTKPTEPTEPTDPSKPTEPTEPTDPSKPTEPTEPTDPGKPTDPTKPSDPSEPSDTTKPTEPSDTTDPSKPSDSTDPSAPSDSTEPTEPEPTEPAGPAYSVTVTDYNGNPKTGVVVQILKNGAVISMLPVDGNGVAAADLPDGEYTVKLLFSGETLYYEEKAAVLTKTASHITLKVAPAVSGQPESINDANAYFVGVGGTYVTTQADVVNFFVFEPTVPGLYRVSVSDPAAQLTYWGGNVFFLPSIPYEMEMKDNGYELNIKESNIGGSHIIGISAVEDGILEIIRVGDPVLSEEDVPYTDYEGTRAVTPFTYTGSGTTKKYFNILSQSKPNLVLNPNDGYYHLDSADGKVVYMDLSASAPYIPLYGIMGMGGVGGENVAHYIYDDNGNLLVKERYNALLQEYAKNVDGTHGIYPLTEDLVYMIQQGGNRKGWWDPESPNFQFTDYPNVNTEIAWMFGLCTMD